jgi:hypothetical protein
MLLKIINTLHYYVPCVWKKNNNTNDSDVGNDLFINCYLQFSINNKFLFRKWK